MKNRCSDEIDQIFDEYWLCPIKHRARKPQDRLPRPGWISGIPLFSGIIAPARLQQKNRHAQKQAIPACSPGYGHYAGARPSVDRVTDEPVPRFLAVPVGNALDAHFVYQRLHAIYPASTRKTRLGPCDISGPAAHVGNAVCRGGTGRCCSRPTRWPYR